MLKRGVGFDPDSKRCQNRLGVNGKCTRKADFKRGDMPVCNKCGQLLRSMFKDKA